MSEKADGSAERGEAKPSRWSKMLLPFSTLLVFAGIGVWYYSVYVSSQRAYFDDRAFRLLALQGDNMLKAIDGIQSVFSASSFYPDARENKVLPGGVKSAEEYLRSNLALFGVMDGTVKADQKYRKPKQYRDGTFLLWGTERDAVLRVHAQYQHPPLSPSVAPKDWGCSDKAPQDPDQEGEERGCFFAKADLNLEPATRQAIAIINEDFYQDVLLVGSSGKVFLQYSSEGPRIQDLGGLVGPGPAGSQPPQKAVVQAQESGSPGKAGAAAGLPAKSWSITVSATGDTGGFGAISKSDNVLPMRVAGTEYKLYLHPLLLPLNNERGERVAMVLCGLRSERQIRSDSYSLPYTYVIVVGLALLALLALAWPALKLSYVSPQDRLQHGHVLLILVSTMIAAAVLTLLALNDSYANRLVKESVNNRLQSMADTLKANLRRELIQALQTLDVCSEEGYLRSLAAKEGWHPETNALAGNGLPGRPLCGKKDRDDLYRYFRFLLWVNQDGLQEFKVAVDPQSTPQTNIAQEDYFRLVAGCLRPPEGLAPAHEYGCELSHLVNQTTGTRYGYRVAPVYSQNTNEFLAVVSAPYSPPVESKALPEKIKRLRVKAIVLHFESLVNAVLPMGYGFAIIDATGKVQFHSTASRNLIENFLVESQQDDALQAAVAGGTRQSLRANYHGSDHAMYVTPLKDFQTPRWTLVVFRDTAYFSTLNLRINLLFALLFAVYSVPGLLWAVSHMLRDAEYPLESVWPVEKKVRNYAQMLLSNIFLSVLFLSVYSDQDHSELLVSIIGLLLVGSVFPFWQGARPGDLAEWLGKSLVGVVLIWLAGLSWFLVYPAAYLALLNPWVAPRVERAAGRFLKLRFAYLLGVVSILVCLVVAPCCALFKMSFETVQRLYLERQEQAVRQSLGKRKDRLQKYYQRIQAAGLEKVRLGETMDRYDGPPPVFRGGTLADLKPSWLDRSEAQIGSLLVQNQLSAELQNLASSDPASLQFGILSVPRPPRQRPIQILRLADTGGSPPVIEPILTVLPVWPGFVGGAWAVFLLSFAAIIVWLDFVTGKVFLIQLQNLPKLDLWEAKQGVRWNLIMIGHPKSGKSTAAQELPNSKPVDLATVATAGSWRQSVPDQDIVILEHFEHDIGSPASNLRKLDLLERLLYVNKKKVVLITTVDPLIYLTAGGRGIAAKRGTHVQDSRRILDRWAAALSSFTKVRIKDKSEAKFDESIARFRRWRRDGASRRFADLVEKECDHTAHLRKFGRMILWPKEQKPLPSRAELIEEVLDRANAYYWTLWATCTRDERLVLFQLAKDGWINPKNEVAIQQLQCRDLILRDSGFRIMNASFRRFILKNENPEEIARWKREGADSIWNTVRLSLSLAVVLLVSWVFYAQQQDIGALAGYLGAAGAAVGTLYKLVSEVRGGGRGGGAGSAPAGAQAV